MCLLASIIFAACDVLYRNAVRAENEVLLVYCERLFCKMCQSTSSDRASDKSTTIK